MAIYVTGDWHGGYGNHERLMPNNWPDGLLLNKDDFLIIAGDCGLYWTEAASEIRERMWLDAQPWTTLFVDGNHENHELLRRLPVEEWHGGKTSLLPGTGIRWLRRGQVFDLSGTSVFALGGAWSIDAQFRMPGEDWWPEELPDAEELREAEAALDAHGWKIDHIITHDCPQKFTEAVTAHSLFGNLHHQDRLTCFLDEVDDRASFSHWWFGHHHQDVDLDERHACLLNRVAQIA